MCDSGVHTEHAESGTLKITCHFQQAVGSGKREVSGKKERNLLAQIPTSPRIEMSDLKIPSEPACLICYHPGL